MVESCDSLLLTSAMSNGFSRRVSELGRYLSPSVDEFCVPAALTTGESFFATSNSA